MKSYLRYQEGLDELLAQIEWGDRIETAPEAVHQALNGGAASALRGYVSRKAIQQAGAFFTEDWLARRAVSRLTSCPGLLERPVWDPTCGSGDLLLRWAESLPVGSDLEATLGRWQGLLHGCDLHQEFVEVAKRRLVLLALARGCRLSSSSPPDFSALFPGMATGDIFAPAQVPPENSTLLMNPPFTQVVAPDDCDWTSGKVSQAALAFLECLARCGRGSRVVAILPDVLRSGPRYAPWRQEVEESLASAKADIVGRFDRHADVDVFILEGTSAPGGGGTIHWCDMKSEDAGEKIGSLCHVRVGAVVPYRTPNRGPWTAYLATGDLPPWGKVTAVPRRRRFGGSTIAPPFVAVRRTSSPSDLQRPIATIVSGSRPIALENHLIALIPHDRRVKTCQSILGNLRDARTRGWLDSRVRCRHLTVTALQELPIWGGDT